MVTMAQLNRTLWLQGAMVTGSHGYNGTAQQDTMVTGSHGYNGTAQQDTMVTGSHGYNGTAQQETMVTGSHGYREPWLQWHSSTGQGGTREHQAYREGTLSAHRRLAGEKDTQNQPNLQFPAQATPSESEQI